MQWGWALMGLALLGDLKGEAEVVSFISLQRQAFKEGVPLHWLRA